MARYCRRCDRYFAHEYSLLQHLEASSSHWHCSQCGHDAPDYDRLISHYRKTGCKLVCEGCCDGQGAGFSDSEDYYDHLEEENVCKHCERHFISPNNLEHHMITHRDANVECYGCDRFFTTYAGMIIHLESGCCASGIDIYDLNESAAMCYQWAQFIHEDYRDSMYECEDPQDDYNEKIYPYFCPTCDCVFPKLSSLFMHVASPACSQRLDGGAIGKLRRWLWRRHA